MTVLDVTALKQKRAQVWDGMEAILTTARSEDRGLSDSERTEFDNREAEYAQLTADIERVERHESRNRARDDVAETRGVSRDELDNADKRYEEAYNRWFRRGIGGLSAEQRTVLDSGHGLNTAPGAPAAGSTGYNGGYLVPQSYWHNLQIALKEYGGILEYCNVLTTETGAPMPWPTVDPTGIVGSYITEQNSLGFGGDSAGGDYQFGQGMLSAWTIVSGVILASLQLIEDSAFDVDSFVSDRIGEACGRKVAAELHSGSGTNAFLGVETALTAKGHGSAYGQGGVYLSGTATKFSATAGGSAFTLQGGTTAQAKLANGLIGWDDIQGMKITVDPAYRKSGRCVWVMNDQTGAMLRTITDAYGHPIWQNSVTAGTPDQIDGYAVVVDQNTSSVSTTASTAGGLLFGDFHTAMVVRQVNGAHTMQLRERYADFLQVGYLGYVRMDSRSNDLRAAALYSTNAT